MNKINQKGDSNSKLLTILCKRDSNTYLNCKEEVWPGKRRPSFAISIRTIQKSQSSNRLTERRDKNSEKNMFKTSRKRLIHTRQVVSSSRSLSLVPKSTAINLGVLQNKALKTEQIKPEKSTFKGISIENLSKKSSRDEMDDYVIDYMAFNYIGKVIDNPQLWAKYVHKKLIN